MPVRLGLPSPSISTKLYGIVALFLAMVYALAAATIHFAAETKSAVSGFQREGLGNVSLTARVQVLLEQHRRMVATAPFASPDASAQDEGVYRELNATIADLIDRIAPDRAEKLSQRFALLASQGSSVFELARHEHRDQAIAVGVRYASAADGLTLEMLTEARRRLTDAEHSLEILAAHALSLTTWVCAAAALTGIGDRSLVSAPAAPDAGTHARHRLVPDPARTQRYLGGNSRHCRSRRVRAAGALGGGLQGQVHRASEQEGRLRTPQPAARCGDQQYAAGTEHVRCARAPAHVQQALHRHVRRARRADTARHGALRAAGVPHQEGCPPFGSRRTRHRRHQPPVVHAGRIRQRPHHRGVAPAAQGRRLGLAARGHHRATPAGREDRAPCASRHADRPRQSHAVPRAARAEPAAARARAGLRRALPRSRPLQGRQRYARTSRRRPAPQAGGQAAARLRAPRRHRRAARRRRICHRAGQRARSRPDGIAGCPHRRGRERSLRNRRQPHRHRHQHRHHAGAARRQRRRQAHEERRPCAVSQQGRRPPRLLVLRAEDA